jgi:16S rRNA (uracil1498-N3)-methyltransferase
MASFFAPELQVDDKFYQLSEEESKHGIRVLRLSKGDYLTLLDGKGHEFKACVVEDHPKKCVVEISEVIFHSPTPIIHVAVAPTKNMDRMEWFLEKATELGLSKCSIFISKNSERTQVKLERLEKIAISAMKQSKRFYLPEIEFISDFRKLIEMYPNGYIAHCIEDKSKLSLKGIELNKTIIIGPEGDFTKDEVQLSFSNGYKPISLGEFRLRTETAALLAVTRQI